MYSIFLAHTPEELEMLYSKEAISLLEGMGKVLFNPYPRVLSDEELTECAADCQFIITTVRTAGSKSLFERSPNLLAFIRAGVDLRNVDIDAATQNGVLVCNCPGIYEAPVVELVIGYLCCISRKIIEHAVNLKKGIANRYTTPDLFGKTLGIVGFGSIGKRVAKAASALGMDILVYDPFVRETEYPLVSLEDLLSRSDFVSLHVVLNSKTEGMIGERELSLMKPTAWLINTARGLLIQEQALYSALTKGTIAGAALDVFATEPDIAGNPLLQLPNVIATPHIGGWSTRVYKEISLKTTELIRELISGKIPESAVNKGQLKEIRLTSAPASNHIEP